MALTSRRLLRFALPTVAALGAGAAVGVAAIPSADGTIHACVTTATGAVRIINAEGGAICTAGTETDLVFNQTGPAGPAGPAGPQGDPGPASGSLDTSSGADNSFSTPSQAGGPNADMFLKLDGIAGDSSDNKHKREINLTSVAFALGRGGDGTGSAAGVAGVAPAAKGRPPTPRGDKAPNAARKGPPADAAGSQALRPRLAQAPPRGRERPAHQVGGADLPPLGRQRRRVPSVHAQRRAGHELRPGRQGRRRPRPRVARGGGRPDRGAGPRDRADRRLRRQQGA